MSTRFDQGELSSTLLEVIERSVQPVHASLWLKEPR